MALDNLISVNFTDEELKRVDDALNIISSVIQPKAVNLSPEERKQYGRIADRNRVLVDKCKTYMEQEPSTVPPTLDKAEFDRDYKVRMQLEAPLQKLTRLMEMFRDTKILLDHDNFNAAISYYRYVKFLSGQNSAGTTSIYRDLNLHYQGRGKKTDDKESTGGKEGADTSSEGATGL